MLTEYPTGDDEACSWRLEWARGIHMCRQFLANRGDVSLSFARDRTSPELGRLPMPARQGLPVGYVPPSRAFAGR